MQNLRVNPSKFILKIISTVICIFFIYNTVLSQNTDNAVLFFIAPGVSSSLNSKKSEFDRKYYSTFSPYLNFTTEIDYRQKLSSSAYLNIGIGISFISYKLIHQNYYLAYENELIDKKISCIVYKIPLYLKYNLIPNSNSHDIAFTLGGEINLINAYGESSKSSGGSVTDSTVYTNYEPYALNASIRTGFEFNNFIKKPLNFFVLFAYQVKPFGQITILNTNTDIGEDVHFAGTLFPKQISLYAGIHYAIFRNL